jgi:hypothetical protein
MKIELLRSFVQAKTSYGNNEAMDNCLWEDFGDIKFTYFQVDDLVVQVIFSKNPLWNCTELSFRTVLKNKVSSLNEVNLFSSYLPDFDMPLNCNRATHVFRNVVYIAFQKLKEYGDIGFNGASPFLDKLYSRLSRMKYFIDFTKENGYNIEKNVRDIFLRKIK